jgi:signal transduction histidine kinase
MTNVETVRYVYKTSIKRDNNQQAGTGFMIRVGSVLLILVYTCSGQTFDTLNKIARESESYRTTTAITKPTPQMVVDQVTEACRLVEKEGKKAFQKFRGKGSRFIFAGTYLWVNDLKGNVLMHPLNPGLENKNILELSDANGKQFILEMINIANQRGDGWVDYTWIMPHTYEQFLKLTYVKKCRCNGVEVFIGCSIDDKLVQQTSYMTK